MLGGLFAALRARLRGELLGHGKPTPIVVPGRDPTVLAFHGFGGTPLEVELIVDAAAELGLRAVAPLLPGHGSSVADLAPMRWHDWAAAAEQALDEIDGPVILAGLSLGSLLAAHLATRADGRIRGLLMLSNAAWLRPTTQQFLRLVEALGLPDFAIPKLGPDIEDPEARRVHLTYGSQPVRAALEIVKAGQRLRSELERITCPTFILHGARDRVCPARNATALVPFLSARDVRVVVLARSRHIITRDVERLRVRTLLKDFLLEMSAPVA